MLLSREINVPYVVSVHGLDVYSTRQVSAFRGEWCRRVSKSVFQSAECVLCISEHVREQVLQGSPESRTSIVYNSADPVLFSPAGATAGPPRVLSIGNLIPIKGHAILLRAVAAVAAQHPMLECDLVGTGPEELHLRALSRELGIDGRVHFLGRRGRREVAGLLRTATLFALPSSYEGLGCVYLEAMSAALPAIGCRGQGIEEVIQHGLNGWLVGPDNLEELTRGITALLGNAQLRTQIGTRARATIVQGFTVEHQAQHLLQVYRECAV
jgi:teichuronic acid biosynthesis glycosyltransferase TuaC